MISDGGLTAGDNYTVTCNVSVIPGLVEDVVVTVVWTNSQGNLLQSNANTLQFEPLLSSDGGQYTCNASVAVPAISVVRRNVEAHNVIVQSKKTPVYTQTIRDRAEMSNTPS